MREAFGFRSLPFFIEKIMPNRFTKASLLIAPYFVMAAALAFCPRASIAQGAQGTPENPNPRVTLQPGSDAARRAQAIPERPSVPAPPRNLWGMWTGPGEALLSNRIPPATPAGQAKLDANVPDPFSASSNDPWKTCDPFGMPRTVNNMIDHIGFAQMPDRIIILSGYDRVWREVWMDGRKPPQKIGHEGGPSTMFYGYSVGHWEGDNTLVVETVGMDDRTWMDRRGYPHSVDAKVTERYTRTDYDHLSMTETVDDPVYYTQPSFILAKLNYRFVPDQEDKNAPIPFTNESLCIPSQATEYYNLIGAPADIDGVTGQKKNQEKK
jgi:hypothetical protein